jgi:hypothetical protein
LACEESLGEFFSRLGYLDTLLFEIDPILYLGLDQFINAYKVECKFLFDLLSQKMFSCIVQANQ